MFIIIEVHFITSIMTEIVLSSWILKSLGREWYILYYMQTHVILCRKPTVVSIQNGMLVKPIRIWRVK